MKLSTPSDERYAGLSGHVSRKTPPPGYITASLDSDVKDAALRRRRVSGISWRPSRVRDRRFSCQLMRAASAHRRPSTFFASDISLYVIPTSGYSEAHTDEKAITPPCP